MDIINRLLLSPAHWVNGTNSEKKYIAFWYFSPNLTLKMSQVQILGGAPQILPQVDCL